MISWTLNWIYSRNNRITTQVTSVQIIAITKMKIKTMSSKTRTSTMPKRSARGCKRSFPFWKFVFNVFIKILAKRRKLMVLVRTIGSCWKRSKLFSVKITCRLISKQCAEFLQIWCLTNFEKKIKMGVTYGTPMANDRLMKELRDIFKSDHYKNGTLLFGWRVDNFK